MSIQEIVNETNQAIIKHREAGTLTKRILAIGIEINQIYFEYLEQLETFNFNIQTGVTVLVDGQKIHFKNMDDFSDWTTEHMT